MTGKAFAAAGLALGLFAAAALADNDTITELLETGKHSIRITCRGDNLSNYSEDCTYQSWNKPKAAGQSKPDFEMKKGFFQMIRYPACHFKAYDFSKGDTEFAIRVLTRMSDDTSNPGPECEELLKARHDGTLEVLIRGKRRGFYDVKISP